MSYKKNWVLLSVRDYMFVYMDFSIVQFVGKWFRGPVYFSDECD